MVIILNWDIISVICAELGRYDLLHVALTSKTFLEPALEHLWRSIDDLYPLLCVLPDTMEIDDQKALSGPVAETSWDRLLYYTRRVRHLNEQHLPYRDHENCVHPSTYVTLSALRRPLFPHIKSVYLDPEVVQSGVYRFFLSDTVQAVYLCMDLDEYQTDRVDGAKDFGPAVSVIAQQVPQLRAMTIEGPCTELFLSLQRLGRLRDLTLSALSQDFMGSSLLKSMSSLPELERLEIFVYDELPKSGVSLAHVDVSEGFCHLTHLDIRTSALGLSRLLDGVPPNQLSSLAWGLTESEDEIILVETAHSQIPDVFSKLATKQRNTLSSLRATWHLFEYVFIEDENKDAIHRWRGVFEVLFGLSGLEKLVYHFPLHFSDNLLQHVANAWPKMVDMRFRRFMEGSVSPSSLSHFARNCPHLRTLFVPLKAGNSDIPPDVSGNETSHPLNTLFVGYGNKPQNPQTLAKYLSQMFPFVNIDGSILEGNNKWKTVQRMLETSRKEGRKELLTGQGPMGDNSTPVV